MLSFLRKLRVASRNPFTASLRSNRGGSNGSPSLRERLQQSRISRGVEEPPEPEPRPIRLTPSYASSAPISWSTPSNPTWMDEALANLREASRREREHLIEYPAELRSEARFPEPRTRQQLDNIAKQRVEDFMTVANEDQTVTHLLKDLSFMKVGRSGSELDEIKGQLKYIQNISEADPIVMHSKYLANFCEEGDSTKPIMDKPKLNTIIFALQKAKTSAVYADKFEEFVKDPKLAKQVVGPTVERVKSAISDAEYNLNDVIDKIDESNRKLNERYRRLQDYRETIEGKKKELAALESGEEILPPIFKEIQEVVAAGNWAFYKYENNAFHFFSVKQMVCRHVNPAAGVDMSVDFGYMHMLIWPDGKVQYENFFGNRSADSKIHPHFTTGSVCWGNKSTEVNTLRSSGKVAKICSLADQLFMTYCPDNPYRTLDDFNSMPMLSKAESNYFTASPEWVKEHVFGSDVYKEWKLEQERLDKQAYSVGTKVKILNVDQLGGDVNQIGCIGTIHAIYDASGNKAKRIRYRDITEGNVSMCEIKYLRADNPAAHNDILKIRERRILGLEVEVVDESSN